MKSLGPNQKQLISSQWGIEQFIVAGTRGAEVPEAGGIEVMKLDAGASQCHPPSGFQDSQGWLSPSAFEKQTRCQNVDRLEEGSGACLEVCVPRSGES